MSWHAAVCVRQTKNNKIKSRCGGWETQLWNNVQYGTVQMSQEELSCHFLSNSSPGFLEVFPSILAPFQSCLYITDNLRINFKCIFTHFVSSCVCKTVWQFRNNMIYKKLLAENEASLSTACSVSLKQKRKKTNVCKVKFKMKKHDLDAHWKHEQGKILKHFTEVLNEPLRAS